MPETDQRERILSAFRREPLLRFLPRVQAASEDASLSRESRSLAKFFLAYSYNETNRSPLAIKTAVAMLADAQNPDEQVLAKHALGGILWHAGHFEAGLTHLWEASEIASSDPIAKAHILTNIAIGSYEARHRSDLSYATAMAEQAYQTAPHAEHSIVLDYVKCLELIETGSPEIAVHFLTQTLINVTSASHRLAVYMLEALALAQLRCGHHAEAQQHLSQARVLRQTLHMSPSIVEARRLRALRREIEREEL